VVAYAHVARDGRDARDRLRHGRHLDRRLARRGGAGGGFEFERVYETETAGVRVFAPMLYPHRRAGGGSLCRFDGYRFRSDPRARGAPGPLC
jgi:hypothetical protein